MIRRPIPKRRAGGPRRGRILDPAYIAWCHANKPCAVKGWRAESPCVGRDTFHHVRSFGSPKDDTRGLLLCLAHHEGQWGAHAIDRGKVKFEQYFGISIDAEVEKNRREYAESLEAIAS